MFFLYLGVLLILLLGFGLSWLAVYYKPSIRFKFLRGLAFTLFGLLVSGLTLILEIMAVWPPYHFLAAVLPVAFLFLMGFLVYLYKEALPARGLSGSDCNG